MKRKLFVGLIGFLLASSTVFAGWGGGFGAAYYGTPGLVYVGPVHGHYHHHWVRPYVGAYVAPAPYVASIVPPAPYVDAVVGPPPFYGAVWIPARWVYGPHGRYWARGYWSRRP
jgi:hypothetical protein